MDEAEPQQAPGLKTPGLMTPGLDKPDPENGDLENADLERAEAARRAGKPYEADGIARDVLIRSPGYAAAIVLRARVALDLGELDRAVGMLEDATARRPEPTSLLLLCNLHRRRFRLDPALRAAAAAVSLATGPARLDPLIELARVQVDRDESDAAAESFLAALAIDPEHAPAHLGLGQVLLGRGDFASGWIEYEWRNKLPEARAQVPKISAPAWNGMTMPRGRLLVVCDQGFGDAMQFSRYLPIVAERVRELVVACGPELSSLIARVPGVAQCWQRWADIPGFTAWVLASSLPYLLGTRADTIPPAPYLTADPERVSNWDDKLRDLANGRRRIGLFWSGRPTHPNNPRRSLSFASLAPIVAAAAVQDCFLVSVQKDLSPSDEAALTRDGVHNVSADLTSFDETAALLTTLDLLITVDSAVAHLAGALDRPACVLVPRPADWRWLRDREDTIWYRSLRLYRQPKPGDWRTPIEAVANDLGRAGALPLHPVGA